MSRDADIGHRLSDKLVDVVDRIRRKVHGSLGTRPWAVARVIRTWSGGERGLGVPKDQVLELDPTPMVRRVTRDRMGPAGREANGNIVVTNVSLRYTFADLQPTLTPAQEVGYALTELHGQLQKPRWFVLSADPIPRRGDKEGDATDWYLVLEETSAMGSLDGVELE